MKKPRETPPQTTPITWKIGGEAGFGIMSIGEMFARVCLRGGRHVFSYTEYPSLIRGGHNTMQITVGAQPMPSHRTEVHVLIALNRETLDLHLREVNPHGIILYDASDRTFAGFEATSVPRHDVQLLGLPLEDLALAGGGIKLMRNTVALGASCALLDIPTDTLTEIIRDEFGHKGEAVVALNTKVLLAGYQAVSDKQRQNCPWSITLQKKSPEQLLLTGNDALALGALQAGCQLYSGYPMTPASSILHFLAKHGPDYGVLVRHAEDEIAAIHHAIGAAYTGVRAMTATSGGGFSLMTEAVGMAAMTEVGIVVVNAQRPGPSTGLPTWTEQGDLRQVLHASQGSFPRIVLAPSSHEECFTLIQDAFNLADQYQTPVIVLTDKYLAEGHRNVPIAALHARPITRGKIWSANDAKPNEPFRRYRTDVADGVAPRSLPGTPSGLFLANSDEHDETGYSSETSADRIAQMERRARKIATLKKTMIPPRSLGPAKAPLTVVTWGSSAGPVEAALGILNERFGRQANALVVTMIAPFPSAAFAAQLQSSEQSVVVEGNRAGHLAGWIRQQTGLTFNHAINRFDGRPFDPAELAEQFAAFSKHP